jgi:redox-sensitive bicupin YhaK (pirin superfamily)
VSNLEAAPVETVCAGSPDARRADVLTGHDVILGKYTTVRRLLPHTHRRMVGAWCFVDLFGPDAIIAGPGMVVPPHPHCGLQTVTWLADGEVLHRDSLGSLAMIRPGQLNLMTAGHGIAHAEVSPDGHGPSLHGLQLWIALPVGVTERHFDHYAELPAYSEGGAHYTVVVGSHAGRTSPARVFSPIVGVDIRLEPGASPTERLDSAFEYAVLALAGSADVEGAEVAPGDLMYLGSGRTELPIATDDGARLFLLGGEPFADELVMWWNFVGRTHEDMVAAREEWTAEIERGEGERFGTVTGYDGPPLPAPEMPTVRLKPRGREGRPL